MKADFTKKLIKWNRDTNTRAMPWKGEKDPYKIWLSEIILQQTRVEQGQKYYEKFINVFPTIHQLAKAPEKKIFKLWEGLGYYSRCRNLIETAKKIVKEYAGKFPSSYDEIKKLKGIGRILPLQFLPLHLICLTPLSMAMWKGCWQDILESLHR